ncbi:MAG: hypothetical protein EBU26_18540 [Verrucomicrobia bacterium]|nr:hypothetical protein [Verrucomicrobiota bacterium]
MLTTADSTERDGLNTLAVNFRTPLERFTNPKAQQVISKLADANYLTISDGVIEITALGRLNIQQIWDELSSELGWAQVA